MKIGYKVQDKNDKFSTILFSTLKKSIVTQEVVKKVYSISDAHFTLSLFLNMLLLITTKINIYLIKIMHM